MELSADDQDALTQVFSSLLPNNSKSNFIVTFENLSANSQPAFITQNEFMRRMKEMAATQSGMNFYGEMPDSFNMVINTAHPLVQRILKNENEACNEKVTPILNKIAELDKKRTELKGDKNESDLAEAIKDEIKKIDDELSSNKKEKQDIFNDFAKNSKEVKQLVDLTLLSNNLLKGEALNQFIQRSIEMI